MGSVCPRSWLRLKTLIIYDNEEGFETLVQDKSKLDQVTKIFQDISYKLRFYNKKKATDQDKVDLNTFTIIL